MFRLIALVFAVVFGTAASQVPEYAQQYRQRIGGAIDALTEVMVRFAADAEAEGLNVAEAIARLRGSADPFVARRGESMEEARARLEHLRAQRDEMARAGPFGRVGLVLTSADGPLARSTLEDFEPAVPVTSEGLAAAGAGGLAGLGLVLVTRGAARGLRRRRRRTVTTTT